VLGGKTWIARAKELRRAKSAAVLFEFEEVWRAHHAAMNKH
jgi:hypothetical protein